MNHSVKRNLAFFLSLIMLVTVFSPLSKTEHVWAEEREAEEVTDVVGPEPLENEEAEGPSFSSQEGQENPSQRDNKVEEKKKAEIKSEAAEPERKSTEKNAMDKAKISEVKAERKTATKIAVTKVPEPYAFISDSGRSDYNPKGIEITVFYDDGTSEIVTMDSDGDAYTDYGEKDYSSKVEISGFWDIKLGENTLKAAYIRENDYKVDEEEELLSVNFSVEGVEAPLPKSIRIVETKAYQNLQSQKVCAGFSGYGFEADGTITIEADYGQYGKKEIRYRDFFSVPYDPSSRITVEDPVIQPGKNEIQVTYEKEIDGDYQEICSTAFTVMGVKEKLPVNLEVEQMPENLIAYIDEFGQTKYHYSEDFGAWKLKIHYDDGSEKIVDMDGGSPLNLRDDLSGIYTNIEIKATDLEIKNNDVTLEYRINSQYNAEPLKIIRNQDLKIQGIAAKIANAIEIAQYPKTTGVYAGLDDDSEYENLKARVLYTDGTEEVVSWDPDIREMEQPICCGGSYGLFLEPIDLKPGENKCDLIYGTGEWEWGELDEEKMRVTFTISAKSFTDYDPSLITDQTVESVIRSSGNAILNANQEMWLDMNTNDPESIHYQYRNNVQKCYDRVFLDTSGLLTVYDGNGKVLGKHTNVKDFSEDRILLQNGDLYTVKDNRKITSDVENWVESGSDILKILKKDGTLLRVTQQAPIATEVVDTGVADVNAGGWVRKNGDLYTDTYDWDTESYGIQKKVENIDYLCNYFFAVSKDGSTYYNGEKILDKRIKAYSYELSLIVDEDNVIYENYSFPTTIQSLPGKFLKFSPRGYWTQNGEHYNRNGKLEEIVDSRGSFRLKADGTLLVNGKKLLTHVSSISWQTTPSLITRTDGTVWIFDQETPKNRARISIPRMLQRGGKDIQSLTIAAIPPKIYTGKPYTPSLIIKDGTKVLKQGVDYVLSYANNVNAGTAKVTITGKGSYTGAITKPFTITKAPSAITAKNFTKTYGNKSFLLGAKVNSGGKLTYKSSSAKVATVSNTGRVTLKGPGKATITITAAATANYNGVTKRVTITVKPKKVAGLKVKKGKKRMTVSWKRDKKATGYQITYAQNKKFQKGKKNITIRRNKTVKRIIKKLKARKTYYVKVRAYKKVGKTKLYGAYSKTRKVRIR